MKPLEHDTNRLQRLREWRNPRDRDLSLGFMPKQFKREVAAPHKQLGPIVELWTTLVPEDLAAHTRLQALRGGVLTVGVDSASHLYSLDRLLRAGLESKMINARPGPIFRRVRLVLAAH